MNIDDKVIALGVRQPWVELIMRGAKTIEVRSRPTNVRGTIYIYAAKKISPLDDATIACHAHDVDVETLELGAIVGQVELVDCRPAEPEDVALSCVSEDVLRGQYGWHLRDAKRFEKPIQPQFLPYGVWFYPFKRHAAKQHAQQQQ